MKLKISIVRNTNGPISSQDLDSMETSADAIRDSQLLNSRQQCNRRTMDNSIR